MGRFFFVIMPEAHSVARCHGAFPPFGVLTMLKYQYLLSKKESGELSILFNHFELPLKYQQWMDIYAYHLEHPKKSQWQVSLAFRVSKGTVWNAYRFMEKVI